MKRTIAGLLAMMLAACGGPDGEDPAPTIGAEIASDYNRAMDDARAVEADLEAQRERLEKSLQAAESAAVDP